MRPLPAGITRKGVACGAASLVAASANGDARRGFCADVPRACRHGVDVIDHLEHAAAVIGPERLEGLLSRDLIRLLRESLPN